MATIAHEHSGHAHVYERETGTSWLIGFIVLLAVLFALFYFGIPMLQNVSQGPQINVPSKLDLNVQTPAK